MKTRSCSKNRLKVNAAVCSRSARLFTHTLSSSDQDERQEYMSAAPSTIDPVLVLLQCPLQDRTDRGGPLTATAVAASGSNH